MNGVFQYIENKKGKPIPLLFKLINNIPLSPEDLVVNRNLDLSFTNITSLPDNLTVNGYLILWKTNISTLPNNLTINGNLDLDFTKITSLPNDLSVDGDLYCYYTPLAYIIKNDVSLLTKYKKQVKGKILYE